MELNEAIVVPVILSIVELLKGVGLKSRYSAAASLGVGMFIGALFLGGGSVRIGIATGAIYGLTASGLYSGAKNTIQQAYSNKGVKKVKI